MARDIIRKLRKGLKNAFDLQSPYGPLTDQDRELLSRLARAVVARRMSAPAVLFLSSVRPLNSVGSQALVFLRPFLSGLVNPADYDRMVAILDRREGLEALVEEIEAAEASGKDREK
jgi:hypothetical protein